VNLLRNEQYMQAEGMISYCLDIKRQNIEAETLRLNQEYHLLQLLLGKTFTGVKRESESQQLLAIHRPLFNLETLILQGYLIDSYRKM